MSPYFCSRLILLVGVGSIVSVPIQAQARKSKAAKPAVVAPAAPETPPPLPKAWPVERATLPNGLRVVVHTDRMAPIVAVGLMVDVGSRDEEAGKSGLAHFFEHMMFQGSAHVGKMEHLKLLEAQGAEVNANTSADRTWYYEVVPKPALQLALWLEADRFAHLKIDAANVDNQRAAVLAEMAERIDNRPLARAGLEVELKAYATWAMGHATIGASEDLQAAPLGAFVDFWKRWYSPNNVVLVLSGDIDLAEARPLLDQTLGRVERRAEVVRQRPAEPEPTEHIAQVVPDALAKAPAIHLAWRVPAYPSPDACALDLLGEILGGDASSRLEKRLVRESPLAIGYFAGTHGRRDADLFHVSVELAEATPAALLLAKRRVHEEIDAIALGGVSEAELQRARLAFESAWTEAATRPEVRAELLGQFETWMGDASQLADVLPRYRAVTAADVQRVARQWLRWDREVEIDAVPASWPQPKQPAKPAKPVWIQKSERAIATAKAREIAAEQRALQEAQRRAAAEAAKAPPLPADATPSGEASPAPIAPEAR